VPRLLAQLADRSRTFRLLVLVLAGLGLAFLVESAAHAVAPASTERAVVIANSVERGEGRRDLDDYRISALLDSGRTIDIADRNALGLYATLRGGMPVLVTRSNADGQVLAVRAPEEHIDTAGFPGAWILRGAAAIGLVGGLALSLRARGRDRWGAAAALVVPAAALSAVVWTGPATGDALTPLDGMSIYDEDLPPVTARGAAVRVQDVTVTVRGVPVPGLPPGADPGLAGFETLTIPLTTRAETAQYVPMDLIGDGAGRAELLDGYPAPACGGAPGALGDEIPAGTTDLVLCAVVPTGFVPRYLVLGTAGPEQTALALR
jgi:hypothetical protein